MPEEEPNRVVHLDNKEKNHISRALSQLLEKTANNRGDPFRKYREKGSFPDTFEYGMNCMVDRVFETQGQEIAQMMYEEFIEEGLLNINLDMRCTDVASVPVLFGVVGPSQAMSAYNRAVAKHDRTAQDVAETLIHGRHPIVTFTLEDENQNERCWRLAVIDMALKERCIILKRKEDHRTALLYQKCGDALEKLIPILDSLDKDATDEETEADAMSLGASAIERVMPEQHEALAGFLMVMASEFWPMLWESLLDIYVESHKATLPDVSALAEHLSAKFRRNTQDFGAGVRYETRKTDIQQLAPKFRAWLDPGVGNDGAAVLYAAAVCGSLDYGHKFPDAVLSADWITQRCLFLELARMNQKDLLPHRWGGGIGRFGPLSSKPAMPR